MALFSLLLVLLLERAKVLSPKLQFETLFERYRQASFDDDKLDQLPQMLLTLLLPAVLLHLLAGFLEGRLFGLLHLLLWIGTGLVLFAHQPLRDRFREYLNAACRGDTQSCYHHAQQLDETGDEAGASESEMGEHMGQLAAWINYRYYAAVALYFVALGPAAALFYSTVRAYHDHFCQQELKRPLVPTLMHLLDWLPARIVALGFALSGHFSRAMGQLLPRLLDPFAPARTLITEVALAAEDLPEHSDDPVSVQSTFALLQLAKRNLILLLVVVSLLTIFGVLQ
ncbi:beta-lactamase regulator AmpE [Ferrimonas marina]|uniref:AmpE protein n=1 Tax=Ferrimonas marina TaxID=299255 RepID=A0A1M5XEV2_9GAMM|nr:beta-lactamase regulator AmpE [Ferrimonas marina]SHH98316.1 AmpE protein [Ferrimonas marina]